MMEEPVKEHSLSSGNSARPKLQRYALRSSANSSESKRGLSSPLVSRSVVGLDFSGKDKSTSSKPPRRLSIPVKASPTPNPKLVGNITPISETRTMRTGNGLGLQSRNQTPASDISRTSSRMKFNLLSSSSYWLNQIKLSESASKHSVSLGFFKLALEARCEPFLKMKDELKSYVDRHQLAELGEVKKLLQSYNIAENIEQPQVSERISQVTEEGAQSSDDEVLCSSSTMDTAKLKPEPLDAEPIQFSPVTTELTKKKTSVATESTKQETSQKNNPGCKLRENHRKNSANSRSASDRRSSRLVKKSEKPTKQQQTNKEKSEIKKQGKKSDIIKVPISPTHAEDTAQGNKENMDAQTNDETSLTEVA